MKCVTTAKRPVHEHACESLCVHVTTSNSLLKPTLLRHGQRQKVDNISSLVRISCYIYKIAWTPCLLFCCLFSVPLNEVINSIFISTNTLSTDKNVWVRKQLKYTTNKSSCRIRVSNTDGGLEPLKLTRTLDRRAQKLREFWKKAVCFPSNHNRPGTFPYIPVHSRTFP